MARKKNAFTLIELLVVISIIALLLSILVPGLRRAKEVAKKTVCLSQQRQWGIATMTYAIENNSAIPYFSSQGGYKNVDANNDLWFQKLTPYLGEQEWKDDYDRSFAAEARRCPAGRKGNKEDIFVAKIWGIDMDGWEGWIGPHYGTVGTAPFYYSDQYLAKGGTINPEFRLSRVKSPSDCLLYMDVNTFYMYHPGSGGNGNWGLTWDLDLDEDGKVDSHSAIYRQEGLPYNCARPKIHYGGCNVTLADGHAEYIKYEELWSVDENNKDMPASHRYWNDVP